MLPWRRALLFLVMGLGSWITINGVYQELPLIASEAPEGYAIFSYMAVVVAAANVFPVAYIAATRTLPPATRARVEHYMVFAVVGVVGTAACAVLAWGWRVTVRGLHGPASVLLLLGAFLGGGVDCMTSVLFYPILQRYSAPDTTALMVGEAATGLLASALAAAQQPAGQGGPTTFPVRDFFLALAGISLASVAAYAAIAWCHPPRPVPGRDEPLLPTTPPPPRHHGKHALGGAGPRLFLQQAVLAVLENGVHVTLLPLALSGHASSASLVAWSVKASAAAASCATLLALVAPPPHHTPWPWAALSAALAGCALWMVVAAAGHGASTPPVLGGTLVTVLKALLAYTKTSLFLQHHGPAEEGMRHAATPAVELASAEAVCGAEGTRQEVPASQEGASDHQTFRWGGAGIQAGSCVGSVLFFLLTVPFPVLRGARP